MREVEFLFRDGLSRGLRKFINSPSNYEELMECHNLAPWETGLLPHDPVISMNSLTGDLLVDENGNYIVTEGDEEIAL